jgi:SAM-dependent methyltransferase
MSGDERDRALSFGGVADAYERGRPSYPRDAVVWLTSDRPTTVLELGAGTGKLTREMVALGHVVHATEPDAAMLEVLQRELPDAQAKVGTAEDVPAPDRSYDVVVAAQAFHWFDLDEALPEIARVLRPGGRLSLVWNERDERIPWVKRLGGLIGSPDQLRDPTEAIEESGLFGAVEFSSHRFWQVVDQHTIQDLALSRSEIAILDEAARAEKLAEVLAFYDDFGRGMDGMQLPYQARCFRAAVLEGARPSTGRRAARNDRDEHGDQGDDPMTDTVPRGRGGRHRDVSATNLPVIDPDDDQVLLIDFH